MQTHAGSSLQVPDNSKEVSCLWVAAGPEHTDETLCRRTRCLAELFEPDCRLDIIAQDCFSGIDVAAKHRIHAFAQEGFGKFLVLLYVPLHELLERFCSCHFCLHSAALPLHILVLAPIRVRGLNIPLLAFFCAARQQNDQRFSVSPEVDAVSIRYSSTPCPTDLTFEKFPCSSRTSARVTLARATESSSANQSANG